MRTTRGTPVASFRLASTPRVYDRSQGGWVDGPTTYVTVMCWRGLAENAASSLHKGEPVVVHGKLRIETWKNDERSGLAVEVEAQTIGHDLSRGVSAFRRSRREAGETNPDILEARGLVRSLHEATETASADADRGTASSNDHVAAGRDSSSSPSGPAGSAAQQLAGPAGRQSVGSAGQQPARQAGDQAGLSSASAGAASPTARPREGDRRSQSTVRPAGADSRAA